MTTSRPCLLLAPFWLLAAQAAPVISTGGVVNAASFRAPMVSGSGLAQGSIATAFGTGLGPVAGQSAAAFPLQGSLAGVSIRLTQGGSAVNALPLFVSAGQINFIVPSNTPLGTVNVAATYNGQTGPPVQVEIVRASFGLFTFFRDYIHRGVVQNFVSESSLPVNLPEASARPGQVLIAYGTGLGAIAAPDNQAAPAGDLTNAPVEILVGNVPARRLYAGRSPCCAGLDQIVFELGADTPEGCVIPVAFGVGGVYGNVAAIAVDAEGGRCTDPAFPPIDVPPGETITYGAINVGRGSGLMASASGPTEVTSDSAGAVFYRIPAGQVLLPLPTQNSCLLTVSSGTVLPGEAPPDPGPTPPDPSGFGYLDAGPSLRLSGSNVSVSLPSIFTGVYGGVVGTFFSGSLSPDTYTVSGTGGKDVGPFSVSVRMGELIEWTNGDSIASVPRNQPLTITWRGGSTGVKPSPTELLGDSVLITGAAGATKNIPGGSQFHVASFTCAAPRTAGVFSVPLWVLQQFPVAEGDLSIAAGRGRRVDFAAAGLDVAIAFGGSGSARRVSYR